MYYSSRVSIVPSDCFQSHTFTFLSHHTNYLFPIRVRCWFYFGRAAELGWAFLCSTQQVDPLEASVRTTPTLRAYSYGRFQIYLSAAGTGSLWFGVSEQFTYSMVTNFYTCGVTVQPLNSTTVSCCCSLFFTNRAANVLTNKYRIRTHTHERTRHCLNCAFGISCPRCVDSGRKCAKLPTQRCWPPAAERKRNLNFSQQGYVRCSFAAPLRTKSAVKFNQGGRAG